MTNDSTQTTDAGAATTRNKRRCQARVIVHGTILIVLKKDSCGDRKAPTMRNDKDFKPCHVQGAESEHSNDECKRNKKKCKRDKQVYYVKKNLGTMRILMVIAVAAAGISPQASTILPCQATGKSTTSRVTTRSPTRLPYQ